MNNEIIQNKDAMYIANFYKGKDNKPSEDIICAYDLLLAKCPIEEFQQRVNSAYILVVNMEPEVEDIISILLCAPLKKRYFSHHEFISVFKDDRNERYYTWTQKALKSAFQKKEWLSEAKAKEPKYNWTDEAAIDFFIMNRVSDKMCRKLIKVMSKHGIPDSMCVFQAYTLAKEAHYWVHRATGEPYINHPLQVAKILSEVGVESAVIAAALLHDVPEDTKYTIEYLTKEFGIKIAEYVKAVTSVDKEIESSKNIIEYQNDKSEIDEKTFERLVQMVESNPNNIFALYIKAADRIHNLRTIDEMPSFKKVEKVDQTETKYLPLFKKYKLNYFVSIIEDLLWRTSNVKLYNSVKRRYDELLFYNKEDIDKTEQLLLTELNHSLKSLCDKHYISGFDIEIEKDEYSPYYIYNLIKNHISDPEHIEKYIDKSIIPICDFDIILDPLGKDSDIGIFSTLFIKLFNENLANTGRTITDIENDVYNRFIVYVEDLHRNIIRYCFVIRDDYNIFRAGSTLGIHIEAEASPITKSDYSKNIKVYLRNGAAIELPEGSRVIDLAFAIHEEIGLSAKSASINDQPASVYNILHDSNRVIIDADTIEEDGVVTKFIPHARIDWLACAVTENAKKKILKFLERMYEGDNPRYESKSKISTGVFNTVFEEINANPIFSKISKEDID